MICNNNNDHKEDDDNTDADDNDDGKITNQDWKCRRIVYNSLL